jgi:hypothetical protein
MSPDLKQIARSAVDLNQLQSEMLTSLLSTTTSLFEHLLSRKPATPQQIETWRALMDATRHKLSEVEAAHAELVQELVDH